MEDTLVCGQGSTDERVGGHIDQIKMPLLVHLASFVL